MSYGLGQTKPNEQMGTNILKPWGSPHHVGCWFYTRPIQQDDVVGYKIIFCLKYLMVTSICVNLFSFFTKLCLQILLLQV